VQLCDFSIKAPYGLKEATVVFVFALLSLAVALCFIELECRCAFSVLYSQSFLSPFTDVYCTQYGCKIKSIVCCVKVNSFYSL